MIEDNERTCISVLSALLQILLAILQVLLNISDQDVKLHSHPNQLHYMVIMHSDVCQSKCFIHE